MSKVGIGVSPNRQAATSKVAAVPGRKIFSQAKGSNGVSSASPKAPSLKAGQSAKLTGK